MGTEDVRGGEGSSAEVKSSVGNLVDLGEGEIPLPRFIVKCAEGVFADLAKLESSASFESFVERMFASGSCCTGLDYEPFLELLYGYMPEKISLALKSREGSGESPLIRFAADISAFRPERRALYKAAGIIDGEAVYIFEPVMLETAVGEPASGEGEGSEPAAASAGKKGVSEHTALSFDEFVADMWSKGVRYGIDAAAVQDAIRSGKSGRIVIARPLEPTPGKDADIEEQMAGLHRDDAPMVLPNGRIDLRHFKNHFPQVRKGARLLKKIPRILGVAGRDVSGAPIEPPLPKDFDLAAQVGLGAQLEICAEGAFIVSGMDGFLSIDTQTNQVAVTEKIVNYGGVSARTTGDICLTCDEFEEHGEIQERRVVKGKSITAFADVFGSVISSGGKIHLKQNLIGGSALNDDGDITIDGLVSGATVRASKGNVVIRKAENCIIVGKRVAIESAIKCDILGEAVEVDASDGCAIAGKSVRVGAAGPRQERETVVSVLVPDLSDFDQKIGGIRKKIEEVEFALARKRQETEAITSQGEVRSYLMLGAKLQKNEVAFTPEQMANWKNLAARVAPALKTLARFNGEFKALQAEKESLDGEIVALRQGKRGAAAGISCAIEASRGDTLVRTMKMKLDAVPLADLEPKQLRARLISPSLPGERLLSGEGGPFNWEYPATGVEE